jgi:hypothetical protein
LPFAHSSNLQFHKGHESRGIASCARIVAAVVDLLDAVGCVALMAWESFATIDRIEVLPGRGTSLNDLARQSSSISTADFPVGAWIGVGVQGLSVSGMWR